MKDRTWTLDLFIVGLSLYLMITGRSPYIVLQHIMQVVLFFTALAFGWCAYVKLRYPR